MTRPIASIIIALLLTVLGCASAAPAAPTAAPGAPTTAPGAPTIPPGLPTTAGVPTIPPAPGGGEVGALDCDALEGAVTAAVGRELADDESAGASDCTFLFLDPDSDIPGLGGSVNVRLEDAGTNSLDLIKSIWPDGGEDISGLGQAAYWADQVPGMYAFDGGNTWAVQMILFDDDVDQKAIATAIMRALLAGV